MNTTVLNAVVVAVPGFSVQIDNCFFFLNCFSDFTSAAALWESVKFHRQLVKPRQKLSSGCVKGTLKFNQ